MIPFNRPPVFGTEIEAVAEAVARRQLDGDGRYTKECEAWLAARLNAPAALLTQSCTDALEMAALLLDLKPGDEVILPSYTFASTASAIALRGAVPVFADVEPGTMNIDAAAIEPLIGPATRAIFAVHYAGRVPDMDAINAIAARHGIAVVEDAAQSIGSTYKGEPAGTHSAISTISFHNSKNVSAGEGGALIVNDPAYADRAFILREKGTNRRAFMEGQVDKYTWVDLGSSFLPSELVAAYLSVQLQHADTITADRAATWARYADRLAPLADEFGLRLPDPVGNQRTLNGHIFHVLLPDARHRETVMEGIKARGIGCSFHYVPLHSSPAGQRLGRAPMGCPVTDDTAPRLMRLPLYYGMPEDAVDRVAEALADTLRGLT